jgi:hypothetical protein
MMMDADECGAIAECLAKETEVIIVAAIIIIIIN